MTIRNILDIIYQTKDVGIDELQLIKWLSVIDKRIKKEVIDICEEYENYKDFNGYNSETSTSTELLVGEEYVNVYLYWLYAQIDIATDEIERYTNDMMMFNTEYSEFKKEYMRTHRQREHYQFIV